MKVKFDGITYFDLDKEKLHLNIYEREEDDCGFLRHLREEHNCTVANDYCLLIWAILHELGHLETQYYSDDDIAIRDLCNRINIKVAARSEAIQNIYYNLPNEYESTEWAIIYEWNNQRKCDWFNRRIDNVRFKIQRLQLKKRKETK